MAKLNKKFIELASKDESVYKEVLEAQVKALAGVIEAHGLTTEAKTAEMAAVEKVAEAHGFKPVAMDELSEDEMKAVAGGAYDPFDDAENMLNLVCIIGGACIGGK